MMSHGFVAYTTAVIVIVGLLGGRPCRAASLQIVDASLAVGDAQWVDFAVDDATGVEGFELVMAYDPAVVQIVGHVRRTAATEGCLVVDNSTQAGILRIALACLSPLQGGGPLLRVPLQARVPGTSPFAITYCRINERAAHAHPVGVVTVHERFATTVATAIDLRPSE